MATIYNFTDINILKFRSLVRPFGFEKFVFEKLNIIRLFCFDISLEKLLDLLTISHNDISWDQIYKSYLWSILYIVTIVCIVTFYTD